MVGGTLLFTFQTASTCMDSQSPEACVLSTAHVQPRRQFSTVLSARLDWSRSIHLNRSPGRHHLRHLQITRPTGTGEHVRHVASL